MIPVVAIVDELTVAFDTARRRCREGHRGFYYACAFLPPDKRNAAFALRAFVELIEQAILTTSDAEAPAAAPTTIGISCCGTNGLDQRVAMVRQRIEQLYTGSIELPLPEFRSPEQQVVLAAQRTIERFEVPRQCWDALTDGCATEVRTARFATRSAVDRFLRLRAGSVGRALAAVFSATHSEAATHAEELAMAVRLTELLLNLSIDWRRGKLFIPLEDLVRAGYSERDLERGVVDDRFRNLIASQVERARDLFRSSASAISWFADDGSRLTAATLAVTAAGRLRAIEQARCNVLTPVPPATWADRARDLATAWRLSRRASNDDPLPAVF